MVVAPGDQRGARGRTECRGVEGVVTEPFSASRSKLGVWIGPPNVRLRRSPHHPSGSTGCSAHLSALRCPSGSPASNPWPGARSCLRRAVADEAAESLGRPPPTRWRGNSDAQHRGDDRKEYLHLIPKGIRRPNGRTTRMRYQQEPEMLLTTYWDVILRGAEQARHLASPSLRLTAV